MKRSSAMVLRFSLLAAGLLLVALASFAQDAAERPGPDKAKDGVQVKLDEIKASMDKERRSLAVVMKKRGDILGKLSALNQQIKRSQDRLDDLEKQKAIVAADVGDIEQGIKYITKSIGEKKKYMALRMRARYKFSRRDTLRVWLEAKSIADFSRRMKYLDSVFLADKHRIDGYRELLGEWSEAKSRLEDKRRSLVAMQKVIGEQKTELEAERGEIAKLLRAVNSERFTHESVLKELEQSAKELTGLLANLDRNGNRLEGGNFKELRGGLCYPAPGAVISGYGKKVHPEFNTVTMQKGIEIGAGKGTPARAVFGGTVRFAQWFRGYGNMVILDHGGGYYTIYAHLSGFRVSVGQEVERGDIIGTVGDTGSLVGPSLYFELRFRQTPQDPAGWLANCVEN